MNGYGRARDGLLGFNLGPHRIAEMGLPKNPRRSGRAINRNHMGKISAIFANARVAHRYSLEENFHQKDVAPAAVLKSWLDMMRMSPKYGELRPSGDGWYILHMHGNLWYEVYSPDAGV